MSLMSVIVESFRKSEDRVTLDRNEYQSKLKDFHKAADEGRSIPVPIYVSPEGRAQISGPALVRTPEFAARMQAVARIARQNGRQP
ncbi:MAG: hypothetical protein JWO78_1614 [Micavibrio sp.]|nr:hypothetical protein [Micavibrio sp.]